MKKMTRKQKNPSVTKLFLRLFLIIVTITLYINRADSRINSRTGKDGTIYYYNKNNQNKTGRFRKIEFNNNIYRELIEEKSKKYGVDPYLINCIIRVESNFDPDAVSVAGAMGLMQLMQVTARIYNINDPLDPSENLDAGIRHVKALLKYFKDDVPLALAAYHAGIGVVSKRMKLPPIKSTIAYVKQVMTYYRGNYNPDNKVNRLYKRITRDGTILIYSR